MRRSIPAELKAKVAMEAIKGQKTINEIASIYEVQPNQVCAWKKQVQESAVALFSKTKEKAAKESDDIKDNLYHKIGQLEIENEFLKKKWHQLQQPKRKDQILKLLTDSKSIRL